MTPGTHAAPSGSPGPASLTVAAARGASASFIDHLAETHRALEAVVGDVPTIEEWSGLLLEALTGGGRLLVAGNGGSAAQAQHLAAELVGRYRHDRPAYSAMALTADSATTTALANDYGIEELFARQVEAHGRAGDVFVALSTSGRSPNVLAATRAAERAGLRTWALTGAAPNPLATAAQAAVAVPSTDTAVIQETHQVVIHLLCEGFDSLLAQRS